MATTVWKGHLVFGLVSIPVRLHRAARKATIRLRYLHAEEPQQPVTVSRPEQALVAGDQPAPVPAKELLRGYEYEPEQYAVIRPEELRRLRLPTSREMQILQFVELVEIDPVYFETSYYVVPDKGGEKAYAVLFEALRRTGHVALAQVSMHGREHIVIVRPGQRGILAHTMYYADEVRAETEFHTDPSLVTSKEVDLAAMVVDALKGPFAPEQYRDRYRDQLEQVIAGKVKSGEVAATAQMARPVERAAAADLMEALNASLDQARGRVAAKPEKSRRPHRRTA